MVDRETMQLAQILWDYHLMHHSLEQADCIIALGSHDIRVAEWAAKLFLEGYAPWLLFSGGLGRLTKEAWTRSEAQTFADVALLAGVPARWILLEERSTNTGENIRFSRAMLEEKNIVANRIILVQKPYMERRSYATFRKQWPGPEVRVSSPPIAMADYPNADISMEKMIQVMTGDLQRIRLYAEKGFQIEQAIPAAVWKAYEGLVSSGFDQYVIKAE